MFAPKLFTTRWLQYKFMMQTLALARRLGQKVADNRTSA